MKYVFILLVMVTIACKSSTPKDHLTKSVEMTIEPEQKEDSEAESRSNDTTTQPFDKVVKTEREWKKLLNEQEFYVLREEGTERPFTSPLLEEKRQGEFVCKACNLALFTSDTKFKSGTGWPSFFQPIADINVKENTDYKIGYARTEVECARCGGHLGHVFNDGPEPTGLRYCINGVSLNFQPAQ